MQIIIIIIIITITITIKVQCLICFQRVRVSEQEILIH